MNGELLGGNFNYYRQALAHMWTSEIIGKSQLRYLLLRSATIEQRRTCKRSLRCHKTDDTQKAGERTLSKEKTVSSSSAAEQGMQGWWCGSPDQQFQWSGGHQRHCASLGSDREVRKHRLLLRSSWRGRKPTGQQRQRSISGLIWLVCVEGQEKEECLQAEEMEQREEVLLFKQRAFSETLTFLEEEAWRALDWMVNRKPVCD